MLTNLNPGIVFVEDKYINMENVNSFKIDNEHLYIELDYFSGLKDILRFGCIQEMKRAVIKFNNAQKAMDFGTNYG